MTRCDRFALALSLIAVLVAYFVTQRVFEAIPHIEDEIAYVWQAKAIAGGQLTLPTPPSPRSFLVPFVIDHDGLRFGKYPLGWPALLAIGVRLGVRDWVNPLLAGLGVWLTYRLGKKTMGETVGLLAGMLTVTSPFFLMNSGSLLSHPFGLVLSAAFVLSWLDAFSESSPGDSPPRVRNLATLVAGLSLGVLALTRPLTALGVGLPFAFHGLYLLARGDGHTRWRVIGIGASALAVGLLYLLWQYAVTGDPLLNPYTFWWAYDRIGFGPGIGRSEGGHSWRIAMINLRASLRSGYRDVFGWGKYSWIFLPFGLLAVVIKRNWRAFQISLVFASLVLVYTAYWIGAWLFGPRYYYEGLFSLTVLSAAGIAMLAGWPIQPGELWRSYQGWRKARPLAVAACVEVLILLSVLVYSPIRVGGMHGLYDMERADLKPFLTSEAQALTPALIVVHPRKWMDYGVLLELEDPFLNTPFIFVISRGEGADETVAAQFPDRAVYHYYPPEEPYKFYKISRPR
jgi:hypothetical protein